MEVHGGQPPSCVGTGCARAAAARGATGTTAPSEDRRQGTRGGVPDLPGALRAPRWTSGPRGLGGLMTDSAERPADQLVARLYDELRVLAHAHLRRERPGHTLGTTALVNE